MWIDAAARVLTRTRKYDRISPVLRSLRWLPVAQRIDFKTALLVYISDMLEPYEPAGTLGTSGRRLLLVPRVRTKQAEAALQVYAPKIWISPPEDVRQASVFKSRLKTVYLAVHMTTESTLSALFAFNLINLFIFYRMILFAFL